MPENKDQKSNGNGNKDQKSNGNGNGNGNDGKKKEEDKTIVDLQTKLKASQSEGIKLKKENTRLTEAQKEKLDVPDDEKRFKELSEKREKGIVEDLRTAEKDEAEEIDRLHEVYGEFKDKKFIKFIDDNPILTEEGKLDYDKLIQLFQRVGSEGAPKRKTPSSDRTGDVPRKEPYKVEGKSMFEISEESKKEIPE